METETFEASSRSRTASDGRSLQCVRVADELEQQTMIPIAVAELRQADRDMAAFELIEADGKDTSLGEGSVYERIGARVDDATAVVDGGTRARKVVPGSCGAARKRNNGIRF